MNRRKLAVATLALSLVGVQVVTWTVVRNRLLSEALVEVIRSPPSSGERFTCTVVDADLIPSVASNLDRISAEAVRVGLRVGTEQQLSSDPRVDLGDCSRIAGEVDWNTPFLARVTIQQWHPDFDSNGFYAYLVPVFGRWLLLGVRQAWF
jgi:hypothetical protein